MRAQVNTQLCADTVHNLSLYKYTIISLSHTYTHINTYILTNLLVMRYTTV